jgi:serine O-acetyltransferase
MHTTLPTPELAAYIGRLLQHHLPDGRSPRLTEGVVRRALDRVEYCFERIQRKYYQDEHGTRFDHLNSDHMASFLWFLGNTAWRETGDDDLPTRLFYLNKVMHGLDLFYSVPMPDIFVLVHPVGTVLGKATYGNYFVAYQNCTVGADTDVYPTFGDSVILYSRSTVLGASTAGNNVVFAANSLLIDSDVPDDSVVVGQYPQHRILPNQRPVRSRCFEPTAAAGHG